MSIESDSIRLAMLQAVGGQTIKAARGSFVGVFGNEYVGIGDGVADVTLQLGPVIKGTSLRDVALG